MSKSGMNNSLVFADAALTAIRAHLPEFSPGDKAPYNPQTRQSIWGTFHQKNPQYVAKSGSFFKRLNNKGITSPCYIRKPSGSVSKPLDPDQMMLTLKEHLKTSSEPSKGDSETLRVLRSIDQNLKEFTALFAQEQIRGPAHRQ